MPPPAVLWDVMGTLVVDPFYEVMPAFFDMTLEQLVRVKHPTAWTRFERGELAEPDFLAIFFADGRPYDSAGFTARVRESYRWIEGMESLLEALHSRGVEMHTLSNYPEWFTWIEERLGLSRYVSWSFVSCRTGIRKPDAAAFRLAARELRREPGDCLFIDDQPRNCEAARGSGMRAIHFQGDVARLRRELSEQGVP
jgi:FMN hydrolase / 5-amino-6-(5-phospho-D-ribitylamino)uracil phosphatase